MAKFCLCVFWGSFLRGEKNTNKSHQKIPGQSRETFVYDVCFFLRWFLRSQSAYIIVAPNSEFAGSQKGGIKGEVKRGKGVREGTGLEGEERGGTNEGKRGWEERGPKAHSKDSDFGAL